MLGTQHGHLGITRHVMLEQAGFETEYFLALMEDGPPLFNLIGQCFQDIDLTESNKVVRKWCLDDNDLAKASFKSEAGTTRGSHQGVQRRWPTDSLAFLHSKEACIHVDTWIHATSDIAIQLPQQWLLPSNNQAANSAGEEQTDLLCATQGASVQVQRQTWLFATFTTPKVKNIITMVIWIHQIRWI
jgi:hypothetical protein